MSESEYRSAYMKGYMDAQKETAEDRKIMDKHDIVEYFKKNGKKISDGAAQNILRAVRYNYNGGCLNSASFITKAEFLAFLDTPERKKVKVI